MKNKTLQKLVLSGLFLAIGYVLPFLTGQIQQIGNMLLPMHIPVLLCGLICGWKYGLAVGAILPLTRSLIFSMPVLYPNAVAMAFELAAYGFFVGFFYKRLSQKGIVGIYLSLIPAMLLGRAVWGVVQVCLLGFGGKAFPFSAFLAGACLNAIPGIILQLVLIPALMAVLQRTQLLPFQNEKNGT